MILNVNRKRWLFTAVLGALLLNGACTAQRVMRPPAPSFPDVAPTRFDDVNFALNNFTVSGISLQEDKDAVHDLGNAFLDYVKANSNFAEVVDQRKGSSSDKEISNAQTTNLEADVNIHLDHTTGRTWILDLMATYPFTGWWPITPSWGKAKVRISAVAKDSSGARIWGKNLTESANFFMFLYSWYRTEPVEDAYRKATSKAFTKITRDLDSNRHKILAALDKPIRRKVKPRARNQALPIMAVFEVQSPTNSFDRKILAQLTDYITMGLAERRAFRVVPKQQLKQELSARKKSSYGSCFDESCQIELGKAVAAEKLMTPKVLKFGEKCALSAAIYDLRTETTDRSAAVRTKCATDALLDAADKLIRKLAN